MTLKSSAAKWSEKHRCYRVRFWESGVSDTWAKVPDDYWPTVFRAVPKTEPAKESVRRDYELKANEWAAAERRRREQLAIDAVRGVASTKMTIRQTFDLYQKENRTDVSAKTLRIDESIFRTVLRHIDVDALTPENIDEPLLKGYVNVRKLDRVQRKNAKGEYVDSGERVRHRTVNDEVELLTRLARFAWTWRSRTGCEGVRLPDKLTNILLQKQNSLQVALTEDEVTALLGAVQHQWRRRIMIFGFATGLREGNLYGLRGEWIDWPNAMLRIPAEAMKGGRKARDLNRPLPSIAMEQLGSPRLSGYIWPNPETGLPYTRIPLARLCATAGIQRISEHDMRTTYVTWLRLHKVDSLVVKALVGHSLDTGDVTDLYTKIMMQSMNEANDIVDAIFRRILGPQQLKVVQGGFGS